jgi:hypothetical protein
MSLHRSALSRRRQSEEEREARVDHQVPLLREVRAAERALPAPVQDAQVGQRAAAKRRSVRAARGAAGLLQAHLRHGAEEADGLKDGLRHRLQPWGQAGSSRGAKQSRSARRLREAPRRKRLARSKDRSASCFFYTVAADRGTRPELAQPSGVRARHPLPRRHDALALPDAQIHVHVYLSSS